MEFKLKGMLDYETGGLAGVRWVQRLIEIMKEYDLKINFNNKEYQNLQNYEILKNYFLKASSFLIDSLLKTPNNESINVNNRFIQLDGINIIKDWIETVRSTNLSNRSDFLSSSLSLLNRLPIDIDILSKTKIGKTINRLTKDNDFIVQNKSTSILKRWKQKAEQSIAKKTEISDNIVKKETKKVVKHETKIDNITNSKIVKWEKEDKLISERLFLSDDPPNAPPVTEDDLEELSKKYLSLKDTNTTE